MQHLTDEKQPADDQGKPTQLSGAQATIRCLEEEGVSHLFVYPGGQALELFDALYGSALLKPVLARHEQGATHAADGYARASGRPGVVLVTSGPGATNTITGIACAYMDSIPLIVISGQVDTDVIGTDAFQESDMTGITLPISKHSYLVKDASELPRIIHEAFYIATTGRPGPVIIDIPGDVARTLIDYRPSTVSDIASYRPTVKGNARQVKQAAALLAAASRAVILAGGGAITAQAAPALAALATGLQIPVATTFMGKGVFPEDHPFSLGVAGQYGGALAARALAEADVILAVGMRFSDRVTGPVKSFAPGARIIHIDIDPAEIGKNIVPEVPIVGDAAIVVAALLEQCQKRGAHPDTVAWLAELAALRLTASSEGAGADDEAAITVSRVIAALDTALSTRDAIVTTEVGEHQVAAARALTRTAPRTFVSSGGLGAMGFGFPAAIGAQLARPSATVVCVAGDGSFQMNVQEMSTALACAAPVKVIIVDNGCLGLVRQMQQAFCGGRCSQTTLVADPDFVKLAAAYGWQGARVSDVRELPIALDELLACEGPALLDVVTAIDDQPVLAQGLADRHMSSITGREE
jgi:acetolactate synthase I/II/III large subunit